jgi:1-pyrroline-5-carboxylate dehydrogenase
MWPLTLPENEPILDYAPGSPERAALESQLTAFQERPLRAALWLSGERVLGSRGQPVTAPHRHSQVVGEVTLASSQEVEAAVLSALEARTTWCQMGLGERARVFLKAAELGSGPFRQKLNAITMLGQSKTMHQAEIDAAAELVDFFRFNVAYAEGLSAGMLRSPRPTHNELELRPLDGFVYAVSPFNFTSIAANLPTAPALMGNSVIWKPSLFAPLAAEVVMELLHEAGLPPGVINLVQGDAAQISAQVLAQPSFAGLHFTGSTLVFDQLSQGIANGLDRYSSYPRVVGETGGKDFIFAHESAEPESLITAIVRGGYEYQGQKCSAVSRVYMPEGLWRQLRGPLLETIRALRFGDITDTTCFMGAVINHGAFARLRAAQARAAADASLQILAGGGGDDSVGFFIEPTLIQTDDPTHWLMQEELFGPIVTLWVYPEDRYEQALELCERTSPYGLTGAVFAQDRAAIKLASQRLRWAAGNFYINDKPTGAVVGQQPFGGSRRSGTNDKAGSPFNLLRWVSPRSIKENFSPPRGYRYPFMT